MSQVVSNNVALFFSIFDKHTEKKSLVGKCFLYTDGHREEFLFLLSGHKCIQSNNGRVSPMWRVEKRPMFTFTSVRDFVIFKANSVLGHVKREYLHFLA